MTPYFGAAVNGVRTEQNGGDGLYGTSNFVDPCGRFVGAVAGDTAEELVVRDLDLIVEVRRGWQLAVLP